MLARAAEASGINFKTFQEDFDLKLIGNGENNFESVARAVHEKYPQLKFESHTFNTGKEKTDFIKNRLNSQLPVLVSLFLFPFNGTKTCHIMAAVDTEGDTLHLLNEINDSQKPDVWKLPLQKIAQVHDSFPEWGNDLAFLNLET